MGNQLVELQLKILWEKILACFSKTEVVGELVRLASNFIHGYTDLLMQVHPL